MKKLVLAGLAIVAASSHANIDQISQDAAKYAVDTYQNTQIHTLANLVSYPTVNKEGISTLTNPDFIGFKALLKNESSSTWF